MAKKIEYTTLAHRYTAKFPVFTYVGIQINFWIVANILLVIVMNLQSLIIGEAFGIRVAGRFGPSLLVAVILGILYGVILGLTGYYLDRKVFRKLSLGKVILFKSLGSLALLVLLLLLLRFVLFDLFISPSLYLPGVIFNEKSWDYLFYLLLIYYFFMTLADQFHQSGKQEIWSGRSDPVTIGEISESQGRGKNFYVYGFEIIDSYG